jgi:hypothetical protein
MVENLGKVLDHTQGVVRNAKRSVSGRITKVGDLYYPCPLANGEVSNILTQTALVVPSHVETGKITTGDLHGRAGTRRKCGA